MKANLLQLPPIKLDYLVSITDETGIFQHSKYAIPNRKEGYTTDDNARALIVCAKHNRIHRNSKTAKLADIYLSFLYYMQMKDGRLHNFLGYDRRFLDDVGSDDSLGRTLWACGYVINSNLDEEKKLLAKEVFDKALPHALTSTSPRTKAFAVLGLSQYQRTFSNDQTLSQRIIELIKQLLKLYTKSSSDEWRWFEAYLTYSNGRLPQALFEAYEHFKNENYLQVAKDSFDFILKVQMRNGIFSPIGNNGWYKKGGLKALYDQQSVEASCMAETALAAFRATHQSNFRTAAQTIFTWFLGKNTKGLRVYNPNTGSCYDGITPEGLNLNQGAEATVTYLLARLDLEMIRS
ncbi:glycosyltransferase [Thermoproteota archaeon]